MPTKILTRGRPSVRASSSNVQNTWEPNVFRQVAEGGAALDALALSVSLSVPQAGVGADLVAGVTVSTAISDSGTAGIGAAPTVNQGGGGSTSFVHGQSFTITGPGGYGTKPTAAPLMFERFESGSFDSHWGETPSQASIQTGNQRNARSTRNALMNGYGSNDAHWAMDGSPVSRDWFLGMWFYLAADWTWGNDLVTDPLANIKVFRMWSPSDPGDESAILVLHGGDWVIAAKAGNTVGSSNATPSLATWHHLQMEFRDSSSTSANDGSFKVWLDGALIISGTSIDFRDTNNLKRPWDLGMWNSHGTSPDQSWQDDTYADTSLARVELGDNAVYANCTRREMQPIVSWANGSIQITANSGSFTNGQTAYLHVADANGGIQSNVATVLISDQIALNHGQSYTLTGSFGTKATPGPQIYDNFQSGTNNANIPGNAPTFTTLSGGAWAWENGPGGATEPKYSNALLRTARSTMCCVCDFAGAQFNISLEINNPQDEYYMTWWTYFNHYSGGISRNTKPFVVYGNANSGNDPHVYVGWGDVSDSSLRTQVADEPGYIDGSSSFGSPATPNFYEGWYRAEVYLKQSTPNVADGIVQFWFTPAGSPRSSTPNVSRNPVITRNNASHVWQQMTVVGAYCDSVNGGGARGYRIYGDTFYMDSTRQRVEIGNATTYAASTMREVQRPTAWNGNISMVLNLGAIPQGTTCYFHIINADGTIQNNVGTGPFVAGT